MTDRDRLIELLQEYTDDNNGGGSNHGLADHLLANGVIVGLVVAALLSWGDDDEGKD